MEAYSSTASEYSYSSSKITSGTAKLFNGDEIVWNYTFDSSELDTLLLQDVVNTMSISDLEE